MSSRASRGRSGSSISRRSRIGNLGPALGILDFERGVQALRLALLRADRRGRAAATRAHPVDARCPYRPGLHGDSTRRISSMREMLVGTGQPAEVHRQPLQHRGGAGQVPHPDRRGAADELPPRGNPRRASSCRSCSRRTRRTSAASSSRRVGTRAASSAATSSIRSRWCGWRSRRTRRRRCAR